MMSEKLTSRIVTDEVRVVFADSVLQFGDETKLEAWMRGIEAFELWLAEVIRAAKRDGWNEGHAAHPYFGVNPYEKEQ